MRMLVRHIRIDHLNRKTLWPLLSRQTLHMLVLLLYHVVSYFLSLHELLVGLYCLVMGHLWLLRLNLLCFWLSSFRFIRYSWFDLLFQLRFHRFLRLFFLFMSLFALFFILFFLDFLLSLLFDNLYLFLELYKFECLFLEWLGLCWQLRFLLLGWWVFLWNLWFSKLSCWLFNNGGFHWTNI